MWRLRRPARTRRSAIAVIVATLAVAMMWLRPRGAIRRIADPEVVAVVGPQTSGEGRAVAALLSRADLATITPSATTFDITDPEMRDQRPGGRAVYFRTVGTDLAQGRAMARFAHDRLGVRRIVLIDDGTDFAVRMVLTLARQAGDLGMTVLARKQIPWTEGDYRPQLRARSGGLGWSQNKWYVEQYLRRHPDALFEPDGP